MPVFRALRKEGSLNVSAPVVFVSFLLLEEQAFPRCFCFMDIMPNHVPGTGSIGIMNMVLALKKLVVLESGKGEWYSGCSGKVLGLGPLG